MKTLTEKQKKVLGWIESSIQKTGKAPTVRELQLLIGCNSPMGVVSHLNALEAKGYIDRINNKARGIIVTSDKNNQPTGEIIQVPLVGNIACGMPIWAEEMIEDIIPLPKTLVKHSKDVFILRAKGDSMNLAGIDDGDFIIFHKRETADIGDKVVVLLGNEATCKKYTVEKNRPVFRAMSTNPENKDVYPENNTFMIQGKVIGVIKNYA
jgi:repressor LexA